MDEFTVVSGEGILDNFIVAIEYDLTVLDKVFQQRVNILGIEPCRAFRKQTGDIFNAKAMYAVFYFDGARRRNFAVAT